MFHRFYNTLFLMCVNKEVILKNLLFEPDKVLTNQEAESETEKHIHKYIDKDCKMMGKPET